MLSRSTSARDARDEIGQRAIFWCDVHFLMIAVKHLGGVLKLLGGAPGLDKGSKAKALRVNGQVEVPAGGQINVTASSGVD